MRIIIYLIFLATPFITGCQKASEKFGYDPPDDLTAHDNGIKEKDRWIPCSEVCLSKEIPRIRNAVLDIQNSSKIELESLKSQIHQLSQESAQRWKLLQDQIAGAEREINLKENGSLFCHPLPKDGSCLSAFEEENSMLVESLPSFIGFSRRIGLLRVSKFRIGFGNGLEVTTSDLTNPLRSSTDPTSSADLKTRFRLLASMDDECGRFPSDRNLKWKILAKGAFVHDDGIGGSTQEVAVSTFERNYYRCYGLEILNSSVSPVEVFGFRVIGEEKPSH